MKTLGKHILAAYYSDARMNILYCLNDIRRKSGKRPIADDAEIGGAFSTLALSAAEPEHQQALIKQLRSCFTFLDVLADPVIKKKKEKKGQRPSAQSAENEEPKAPETPTPQRYEAVLTNLFAIIVNLRNTMIHPTDPGKPVAGRAYRYLFGNLVRIYRSSLLTVKTRFSLPDEAVKPLLRCDNKGRAKPAGGFSLSLGDAPPEEDGELSLLDKLHDFGHVLLCSLFLDKSQSAELVSLFIQAYPKPWNPAQQSIIRELVAVFRSRLPLQRLQSDHTETAVTLDALSELSRCPRPLVECLSPDALKAFRGSGPTQPGEETADESSTLFVRGYEDRFIPLMMRFMDFDPECRIRFAVDLGQFCYNVRMKPPGQFTDNRPHVRRLSQKILAYGRLADFEEADKPEVWRHLEDNHAVSADEAEAARKEVTHEVRQLKPYIIPRYPQYHYFDDKIGCRLARADETAAYPVLTTKDVREPVALELLPDLATGQAMLPDFWISPSQLLHLGFYLHLHEAQPRHLSLDALLRRYRIGMTRLLQSLASGIPDLGGAPHSDERRAALRRWIDGFFDRHGEPPFTLSFADLPRVLVLELLGAKPPALSREEVIARAAHVLAETQRRQRQLEFLRSNDRKRGKKGFRPIKCGPIGVFLADDFLRFQPVDVSRPDGGKLNSQRYQILQASLAYYAAHIDEPPKIVDLLHDAGMLDGDYAHPFLKDLPFSDNPRQFPGLLTFHEAYLKARERYVKAQHRRLAQGTGAVEVPHWLGLRQPATLQSWMGEQIDSAGNLKQPLPVPRSLFYRPLLTMVGEALDIAPQELEREGTQQFAQGEREARPSITWLIKRYLDGHQRDGSQEMYGLPRHYDVFDTHLDTRTEKQAHQPKRLHYMTVSQRRDYTEEVRAVIRGLQDEDLKGKRERSLSAYRANERALRQLAAQDMVLFLRAKRRLAELQYSRGAPDSGWSLRTLEATLLNTPIHYALPVPDTGRVFFHPECKIRDRGELSLLVRDRRLPSLLAYYPEQETTLHHAEIRAELASYRRVRVRAMELVHELERRIVACLGAVAVRAKEEREATKPLLGEARHGDLLSALHTAQQAAGRPLAGAFADECFLRTRELRNAFAHNQYPTATMFEDIPRAIAGEAVPANPANHRKVVEKLVGRLETLYKPWLDFLASAGKG